MSLLFVLRCDASIAHFVGYYHSRSRLARAERRGRLDANHRREAILASDADVAVSRPASFTAAIDRKKVHHIESRLVATMCKSFLFFFVFDAYLKERQRYRR